MRSQNQKYKCQPASPRRGFTLIEVLVMIGTVCLLASLMLPAMARTKTKSPSAACLSSLRQMQLGATMYRDDNNDFLLPNAPAGVSGWVKGVAEGWGPYDPNTNITSCSSALLWPYVNQDILVYRCPADFKPSDNGYRLRSRSMNGQMGVTPGEAPNNPNWRSYQKGSDLTCPTPGNAWIFCDESAYTLNDGYLQLNPGSTSYADVPAAYHAGGCGFCFADGHAEIHRWQYQTLIGVPYAYGVQNNASFTPTSAQDPDYAWLNQHAACHK